MAQEAEAPAEGETPEATTVETEVKETKKFDESYVKELRAENAATRKKAQEAFARLEELELRDKTEAEKAAAKATKEQQRADAAEARLARYEVATDKKVPAEAVEFLQGNTREELEASADKLLELVKSGTTSNDSPNFDGGPREPAPEPLSPEEAHNKTFLEALGLTPPN